MEYELNWVWADSISSITHCRYFTNKRKMINYANKIKDACYTLYYIDDNGNRTAIK